jgi:hypothetical protein
MSGNLPSTGITEYYKIHSPERKVLHDKIEYHIWNVAEIL